VGAYHKVDVEDDATASILPIQQHGMRPVDGEAYHMFGREEDDTTASILPIQQHGMRPVDGGNVCSDYTML